MPEDLVLVLSDLSLELQERVLQFLARRRPKLEFQRSPVDGLWSAALVAPSPIIFQLAQQYKKPSIDSAPKHVIQASEIDPSVGYVDFLLPFVDSTLAPIDGQPYVPLKLPPPRPASWVIAEIEHFYQQRTEILRNEMQLDDASPVFVQLKKLVAGKPANNLTFTAFVQQRLARRVGRGRANQAALYFVSSLRAHRLTYATIHRFARFLEGKHTAAELVAYLFARYSIISLVRQMVSTPPHPALTAAPKKNSEPTTPIDAALIFTPSTSSAAAPPSALMLNIAMITQILNRMLPKQFHEITMAHLAARVGSTTAPLLGLWNAPITPKNAQQVFKPVFPIEHMLSALLHVFSTEIMSDVSVQISSVEASAGVAEGADAARDSRRLAEIDGPCDLGGLEDAMLAVLVCTRLGRQMTDAEVRKAATPDEVALAKRGAEDFASGDATALSGEPIRNVQISPEIHRSAMRATQRRKQAQDQDGPRPGPAPQSKRVVAPAASVRGPQGRGSQSQK